MPNIFNSAQNINPYSSDFQSANINKAEKQPAEKSAMPKLSFDNLLKLYMTEIESNAKTAALGEGSGGGGGSQATGMATMISTLQSMQNGEQLSKDLQEINSSIAEMNGRSLIGQYTLRNDGNISKENVANDGGVDIIYQLHSSASSAELRIKDKNSGIKQNVTIEHPKFGEVGVYSLKLTSEQQKALEQGALHIEVVGLDSQSKPLEFGAILQPMRIVGFDGQNNSLLLENNEVIKAEDIRMHFHNKSEKYLSEISNTQQSLGLTLNKIYDKAEFINTSQDKLVSQGVEMRANQRNIYDELQLLKNLNKEI